MPVSEPQIRQSDCIKCVKITHLPFFFSSNQVRFNESFPFNDLVIFSERNNKAKACSAIVCNSCLLLVRIATIQAKNKRLLIIMYL